MEPSDLATNSCQNLRQTHDTTCDLGAGRLLCLRERSAIHLRLTGQLQTEPLPGCLFAMLLRLPAGVSVHRAAGTLCALDSCSGPVRTPSGLCVCRQLGPRVFPDGRCCRWAGGRGVPASGGPLVPTVGFLVQYSCRDRLLWSCPFCLGLCPAGGRRTRKFVLPPA